MTRKQFFHRYLYKKVLAQKSTDELEVTRASRKEKKDISAMGRS